MFATLLKVCNIRELLDRNSDAIIKHFYTAALIGMYGFGRKDFACENSYCPFRHPSEVLEEFAIDESKFSMDAAALVIIFLALQTFTVGSLHWKIKRNRSTI